MSKNNKTFIIQYDPTATPREMFQGFWEAVEKGEKSIQPKNLMVVDSIETINKLMTEPRLEIFYAISEKKPASLNQLAESLGKNSANV
jgi:predicted transcriptional regulator